MDMYKIIKDRKRIKTSLEDSIEQNEMPIVGVIRMGMFNVYKKIEDEKKLKIFDDFRNQKIMV